MSSQVPRPAYVERGREDPLALAAGAANTAASTNATSRRRRDPESVAMRKVCQDGFETGATGLEPATSGVTGRRSNQLNYAPAGDLV